MSKQEQQAEQISEEQPHDGMNTDTPEAQQPAPMTPITIGDEQYILEALPAKIQHLIGVYRLWTDDLQKILRDEELLRMNKAKNEAALRDLSREIQQSINDIKQQAADLKALNDSKIDDIDISGS